VDRYHATTRTEWLGPQPPCMTARPLHGPSSSAAGDGERHADTAPPATDRDGAPDDPDVVATRPDGAGPAPDTAPSASRRRVLAALGTAAGAGLAGCAGRLPGNAASLDVATRVTDDGLVWDYPAAAVDGEADSDGIGYAAVRFRVLDTAGPDGAVEPALTLRLNSTVGDIAADEPHRGYQADRFRFRLGVPRSYDDVAGLRAAVDPPAWPALRTTYGYVDGRRTLTVAAPAVHTDGTVTVEGRFRPPGATLPRRLFCGFEVHASRPTPAGRDVVAADREAFDLSALDLPEGVTLA